MQYVLIIILVILIIVFLPIIISFIWSIIIFLAALISQFWLIFLILIIGLIAFIIINILHEKIKNYNHPYKRLFLISATILTSFIIVLSVLVKSSTILIYPIKCSFSRYLIDNAKNGRINKKLYADRDTSFTNFDYLTLGSTLNEVTTLLSEELSLKAVDEQDNQIDSILRSRGESSNFEKKYIRKITIGGKEFITRCILYFNSSNVLYELSYQISFHSYSDQDLYKYQKQWRNEIIETLGRRRLEISDLFDGSTIYRWIKGDNQIELKNYTLTISKVLL